MARTALGWSVRDLARQARVGSTTVGRIEAGKGTPHTATLTVLRQTFEAAGVEFIGSAGLRLREERPAEAAAS